MEIVPVSLCYQCDGLPGALLSEATLAEGGLDQTYILIPEDGVRGLFPCCRS